MSYYRTVPINMHHDPRYRRLSRPQPNAQSLYLFLRTGDHTSGVPGLSGAGAARLAEELEWDTQDFLACFAELEREGMAVADWKARVVWLPGLIDEPGGAPHNADVVQGWVALLTPIHECELKRTAIRSLYDSLREKDRAREGKKPLAAPLLAAFPWLGDTVGDTVPDTVGDTVGDTVPPTVGDTKGDIGSGSVLDLEDLEPTSTAAAHRVVIPPCDSVATNPPAVQCAALRDDDDRTLGEPQVLARAGPDDATVDIAGLERLAQSWGWTRLKPAAIPAARRLAPFSRRELDYARDVADGEAVRSGRKRANIGLLLSIVERVRGEQDAAASMSLARAGPDPPGMSQAARQYARAIDNLMRGVFDDGVEQEPRDAGAR